MARINELYEKIASQIVAQMADGALPWHRPWAVNPNGRVSKTLRENAVPYQGINVLILWGAAIDAGYASPFGMTYRQAQSIGAQVRKGERATHIVFAKTAKRTETDAFGDETEVLLPVRRVYAVFNADQIDGLPEKYVPEIPQVNPDERDAACQAWIDRLGIEIRDGGQRAYYAPGPDRVQMPPFESFETFESRDHFFSTLAHELTHSTGHKDRLDRLRGRGRSSWRSSAAHFCAPISASPPVPARTTRATSPRGSNCSPTSRARCSTRRPGRSRRSSSCTRCTRATLLKRGFAIPANDRADQLPASAPSRVGTSRRPAAGLPQRHCVRLPHHLPPGPSRAPASTPGPCSRHHPDVAGGTRHLRTHRRPPPATSRARSSCQCHRRAATRSPPDQCLSSATSGSRCCGVLVPFVLRYASPARAASWIRNRCGHARGACRTPGPLPGSGDAGAESRASRPSSSWSAHWLKRP